jgi:hypothetical protein
MKLTKFTLTDAQFNNFERWLRTHYNYPRMGISLFLVDKFLGHYYGVQMLNWMDKSFVTLTPANAGFFVLAMSDSSASRSTE